MDMGNLCGAETLSGATPTGALRDGRRVPRPLREQVGPDPATALSGVRPACWRPR